jgi:SAM-dependent methyltransferase
VSERRARSFGSVAEDYDATRAGWPLEPFTIAFEHFGVPERPDVADIAAGTGKLTRTLARVAGTLVAVEPDADLRAVLQRELPAITVLAGTAEELPLPAGSADVACAGQAFHWFDVDRALAEIARVLRPGGVVIAGWNLPPEDGTWYDAVVEYLHVANPDYLPARTQDWAAVLGAHPSYTGLLEISARHDQPIDRAAFRRLLGTHSAINILPPARRTHLIDEAIAVADAHAAFDNEGQGAITWRCDLFAMQRKRAPGV